MGPVTLFFFSMCADRGSFWGDPTVHSKFSPPWAEKIAPPPSTPNKKRFHGVETPTETTVSGRATNSMTRYGKGEGGERRFLGDPNVHSNFPSPPC